MVWDKDIIVSNSSDIPQSHFLTSKSGPNGELILGWDECPLIWLATAKFQVIKGDGSTWFSQGGIQVSTNMDVNQFRPKIAGIREDGNLYVFFKQTDIHQRKFDLYGQSLSADRGRLWGDLGEKLIDSIPNRDLLTTLVNDSILIMFTQDIKGDSTSANILSLSNVTSQGKFGWADSTMTLGQYNAQKEYLALSNTSTDETALAWLEILPSGNRIVKAQNIFNNGRIGSFSDFIDYPITGDKFFLGYNPENECLSFNNLIGNERIVIHDINGGLVLNKVGKDIVAFQSQKPGLFIVEIFRGQIRLESNKFVVF
jgi:hypothetical protein